MGLIVFWVICAAGGQHEEHLVLRSPDSPVRDAFWQDVVNKNSAEPKAAQSRRGDLNWCEPKVEIKEVRI